MIEKFCSQCGTAREWKFDGGRQRPTCPACGHVFYGYYSLGAGGLLVQDGCVLLVQRGREPNIHSWTLPSGYVETDESPDEAIVREFREETSLRVQVNGLIGCWHSFPAAEHTIYCVFGLALEGPLSDLKADGNETECVAFFSPTEFASLPDLGPLSRWFCEHYTPADVALARLPRDLQPNQRNPERKLSIFIPMHSP